MLLRYEVKKTFGYNRGFLSFLVFAILSIAILAVTDAPADIHQFYNRDEFEIYLSQLHGSLTSEKENFLNNEALTISEAEIGYTHLLEHYFDGSVSESDFNTQKALLKSQVENKQGFDVIHAQYRYLYEHPESRYFMATNGWQAMLSSDGLQNILLLSLIILWAVPIFCQEYRCGMDQIALATQLGSKSYAVYKPLLLCAASCCATAFQTAAKLLFVGFKYGLSDFSFPLQSIPSFGTCTKQLTLGQGLAFTVCSRFLGALLFACILLAVSSISRDVTVTVFFSVAIAFLPTILLRDTLQYMLPLPGTFLQAEGFLQGTKRVQSPLGEPQILFREAGWLQIAFLFLLACLLCCLFLFLVKRKNYNAWLLPNQK